MMDLMGKSRKISVAISEGNDSHQIEWLLSDNAAEIQRDRERDDKEERKVVYTDEACGLVNCEVVEWRK